MTNTQSTRKDQMQAVETLRYRIEMIESAQMSFKLHSEFNAFIMHLNNAFQEQSLARPSTK